VQKVREYYQASPERLDFSNPSTLGTINRWASDHTEGIIGNVLNEIDPSTVSYLLNAIYFKGEWAAPFDKSLTKKEVFFGGKNLVDMMNCMRMFDYAESEDLQALRMPYGNGAYSMTILLPRVGKSLSDILKIMTAEEWAELTTALSEALVDVKMPKFETTTEVCLNEVLSDLGMPKAFTSQAEFPDFCNVPTFIGFCKQSSQIKVDEEGTVAAVVTTTVMDTEYYVQAERAEFHATRPFIYVISEKSTGAIFFIGSYMGD
jgi:serpin B